MATSGRKRSPSLSPERMRNLKQYKDMSDDEFNSIMSKKLVGLSVDKELSRRAEEKLEEILRDYDTDDINSNDMLMLKSLARSLLELEDYEEMAYSTRIGGLDIDSILFLEKLTNMMNKLRSDISKLQDDLKLTRKLRKSDKEQSTINYLEDLQRKAREFYKQKMAYILCPSCKTLLGTIWTLYPDKSDNKITLVCDKVLESGSKCNTKVTVTTKELMENRGSNIPEALPESLR